MVLKKDPSLGVNDDSGLIEIVDPLTEGGDRASSSVVESVRQIDREKGLRDDEEQTGGDQARDKNGLDGVLVLLQGDSADGEQKQRYQQR